MSEKSQQKEEQMVMLELGWYMCNCLWVASVAERVYIL
jgi:hypothetical protein